MQNTNLKAIQIKFYEINEHKKNDHKVKILLVKDELINQKVMLLKLKQVGDFNITVTNSGENALPLLEKERFDLALIDVGLPSISGVELVNLIRNNSVFHQPLIVLCTAFSSTQCQQMGPYTVNGHLQKRFDNEVLAEILDKLH